MKRAFSSLRCFSRTPSSSRSLAAAAFTAAALVACSDPPASPFNSTTATGAGVQPGSTVTGGAGTPGTNATLGGGGAAANETGAPSGTGAGGSTSTGIPSGILQAAGAGAVPGGGGMVNDVVGSTAGTPEPQATCQASFEAAALDGVAHTISVASTTSRGELPHFWSTFGTGHLGLFLREDRGWGEILKRHVADGVQNLGVTSLRQHGLFHDDVGIYKEENGVPTYDFSKSDQIFDFFVEQGISPIVELAPMPSALAANPSSTVFDWGMGISPPKDYALWQELIYEFVQHSLDRYGPEVVDKWYWEVWNEPECCNRKFWDGTLDEYFELYDHTAAWVRRALPGGRVGGPVASQPLELTSNSEIGRKFLEHVTTDNYVNPGSPGVLDFFAYHSWSFVDGAVNGYFQGLDLLDSFGLNTQIAVTEFGPTWEFNLFDEPQEMHQGAAFVAQTYSDIARRSALENRRFPIAYSWWVLSDVFEEERYREDEPFIGCMGLNSREDIHKPAYNAYKFLAQMGSEQVATEIQTSGGVGGMAARGADGGIQVLIYNGQNPGRGPADDTYYQVTDAHEIALTVSNLSPEFPYDVAAYRVDENNGNAYAAWQGLGRPTMPNMTEADWQLLRDAMDSPEESLGTALCGDTFSGRFSLPSPGVLFVKLTPSRG